MDYERLGIIIFFLTSAIAGGITVLAWSRRNTTTGMAFFWMMLCAFIWCAGVTTEMLTPDLDKRVLLTNVQFLGVTYLPMAELVTILYFIGRQPSRRFLLGLAVIPTLTNIVIWTNPLHHWFRGRPHFDPTAPFPMVVYDYQWWFYLINTPFLYLYLISGIILAILAIPKLPIIYRRQMMVFLAGLILPIVMNFLYVFGYSPIPHFDLTPTTFSVVGLLMIWNLFEFRFLDLLPLAREFVFDHMEEGILILDHRQRIVDANLAAWRMTDLDANAIGKDVSVISAPLAERLQEMKRSNLLASDIAIEWPDKVFYELKISPISKEEEKIGEIVSIRDVTERIELYNQVRDLAIHDSLSGVFSRRHFLELLNKPLSYIERNPEYRISILLMDIDHFKRINDTYGHEAGDQALRALAQECQANIRQMDAVGRWGGDEFIVLLEDVDTDEASRIAERIRTEIASIDIATHSGDIRMTCSIGLVNSADLPEGKVNAENLFHQADYVLYYAKELGRNRLVTVRDLVDGVKTAVA